MKKYGFFRIISNEPKHIIAFGVAVLITLLTFLVLLILINLNFHDPNSPRFYAYAPLWLLIILTVAVNVNEIRNYLRKKRILENGIHTEAKIEAIQLTGRFEAHSRDVVKVNKVPNKTRGILITFDCHKENGESFKLTHRFDKSALSFIEIIKKGDKIKLIHHPNNVDFFEFYDKWFSSGKKPVDISENSNIKE